MCVWINSSHCCMADILLNVRKAKYLFSTIFVGTNSDCDVIYALCPKAMITWNFFSYVFWQWDQYHHLFQIQSDLFVRTPINQNPRYPKQIARNRFFPTHFIQGRIKGAGQLPRDPRDEIYLFQIKYSYEKLWLALQEYNSLLYSYVALSIWAPNQWRN